MAGNRQLHSHLDVNLKSYLNADGFLGGLTLSRENTRLRPEYEDILRFYGFDLSSIEQEANVTVSVEDTSATSELPTSTVDLTSVEATSTGSAADTTTLTTTGAVATTLPSSETTLAPSATQQTVTTPMTANAPTTTSAPASENTAAAPLTIVTSAGQPPAAIGAENVAPNTPVNTGQASTPAMDSQATSSSTMVTVVVAGNQSPQMPTAAGDVTTNEAAVAESNAGDASTNVPTIPPSVQADTTVVPETEAAPTPGTEKTPAVVTNPATAETEAAANTIAVNTTTPGEIADTATSSPQVPLAPITPDTATSSPQVPVAPITPDTATIPTMDIVPNTEPSATTTPSVTSAGDTSETTTAIDLTTASMTDAADASNAAGAEATTVISSVPNGTSPDDLVGNSNNSTIAASADNQAIGRKKKSIEREATELESKVRDGTYGGTVKDESTSDRPAHLRKRPARSPRGYFSSYPGTIERFSPIRDELRADIGSL